MSEWDWDQEYRGWDSRSLLYRLRCRVLQWLNLAQPWTSKWTGSQRRPGAR